MNTAKIVTAFFLGATIFSYISFNWGVKCTKKELNVPEVIVIDTTRKN